MRMRDYAVLALQIPVALVLAGYVYWVLVIIPAVIFGLFLKARLRDSTTTGVFMLLGVLLSLIITDYTGGFRQVSLFASIAGIPRGVAVPLILILLFSFLLGMLGSMLGSSFIFKREKEEVKSAQ